MPTGKGLRLRCYTYRKDSTLVFDRLFGFGQSAYYSRKMP